MLSVFLLSQMPQVEISGAVVDSATGQPLQYAVVVLYRASDSSQVDGTYTDESGRFRFEVRPGMYYMTVDFIGFRSRKVGPFRAFPPSVDLGKIALSPSAIQMEQEVVEAEPLRVRYEVDRKVITPSSDITSSGGNAADVLRNAPGVEVDLEGNVRIRGSDRFTLLINGRPTVMDPKDALQSIPVSQIERIEIITNPSARYDPEGNAIINIITKRTASASRGGMVSLMLGTYDNLGLNFLMNRKEGRWNLYAGGRGSMFAFYNNYSQITVQGTDTLLYSPDGTARRRMIPLFLYAGFDYDRDAHFLNMEVGGGRFIYQGGNSTTYITPTDTTYSTTDGQFGGNRYSITLDYQHRGSGTLESMLYFSGFGFDKNFTTRATDEYMRTFGDGQRNRTRWDLSYVSGDERRLDMGYRLDLRTSNSVEGFDYYSPVDSLVMQYLYYIRSKRVIHAAYTEYTMKMGIFTLKAGLRGEYTYRDIYTSSDQWSRVVVEALDFFPTFHAMAKKDNREYRFSYSRRINRPSDFSLLPIRIWRGIREAMEGNPDLLPEYSDKAEGGFSIYGDRIYFSADAFYSYDRNVIERYSVLDSGIVVFRVDNVGNRSSYGLESSFEYTFGRGRSFALDFMGYRYDFGSGTSGFYYRAEGTIRWRIAFAGLELKATYRGPYTTPVSRVEGTFSVDGGISTFLSRRLRVNISFRDMLNTYRVKQTSYFDGQEVVSVSKPYYPRLSISFTYIFDRVKVKRKFIREEGGFEMF